MVGRSARWRLLPYLRCEILELGKVTPDPARGACHLRSSDAVTLPPTLPTPTPIQVDEIHHCTHLHSAVLLPPTGKMLIRHREEDVQEAAACFNRLPLFEHQQQHIPSPTLDSLAAIFIEHDVQEHFGICLLHRHCETEPDWVMTHSIAADGDDLCLPEPLERRRHLGPIRPCSYFYSDAHGYFLPFEFESIRAGAAPAAAETAVSEEFLSDLASFLCAHSLQKILGLSRVSPLDRPWIEHPNPHGPGTIAVQCHRELHPTDGIPTEWTFLLHGGRLQIRTLKACKSTPSGVHEPKDTFTSAIGLREMKRGAD